MINQTPDLKFVNLPFRTITALNFILSCWANSLTDFKCCCGCYHRLLVLPHWCYHLLFSLRTTLCLLCVRAQWGLQNKQTHFHQSTHRCFSQEVVVLLLLLCSEKMMLLFLVWILKWLQLCRCQVVTQEISAKSQLRLKYRETKTVICSVLFLWRNPDHRCRITSTCTPLNLPGFTARGQHVHTLFHVCFQCFLEPVWSLLTLHHHFPQVTPASRLPPTPAGATLASPLDTPTSFLVITSHFLLLIQWDVVFLTRWQQDDTQW